MRHKHLRRVVCAAIRNSDGLIICGPRHHHCIKLAHDLNLYRAADELKWEQGFVDQRNKFLTRVEALRLARKRGQAHPTEDDILLFSEDLY